MSARRAILLVSIVLTGAMSDLVPSAAFGHEEDAHQAEDSVPHGVSDEPRLEGFTSRATARDAATAAAAVSGTEQDVGQWGPVVDWPVVGIHVALLPNGKVLAYDSVGDKAAETYTVHDHTRATVWDPATGTQTPVDVNTGFNVFCSGLAHLTDGSIFLAGGNKDAQLNGIVQTHTFNPETNTWSLGPNMVAGRWYPSVTPLRNGEMLITEGGPDMPEVRTTAGGLRSLTTASLNLPLYPWIDVAPDGRAFYSGPDQTMRSLDTTGGGAWQAFGERDTLNRSYGSRALYDVGKILVAGGGSSSADARVIDINGATPQVSATAPMATGRRQHNLTVLADGTVLATGGNSSGASLVDLDNGVYPAEQWNPATGQWKTLAAMQVTRQYHSTALLLPDARVLSAGGGICGTCDTVGYLAKNAEVFTPPYLFKKDGSGEPATRPTITAAPSEAAYARPFTISTPEAASISKLALVRLGAVTHSVNMEQRYIPLSFTRGSGTLTATAPSNANVAPPGMYMLFAIDGNGVPSTATMVTLKDNVSPTVGLTQPAGGATFTAPATVSIAANAADTDGTVAKVEFFNGATKLGEDTTAPYTYNWTGVAGGSYTLTARATDNLGATTTSAARTITVFVTPPSGSPSPITDFGAEPQPTASHALVPSVAPPIAVPAPKARRYSGRVVRVVNGDTVRVRLSSGRVRSVRLLGIDSPNRKQPGAPAECGSRQAASALRGLLVQGRRGRLGGRRVRLTTDPTQDRYDHYGRLLAYASRGSLDINREMVRRGWAMVYVYNGKPARRTYSYSAAQSSAKAARRGAWRICGGDFHRG